MTPDDQANYNRVEMAACAVMALCVSAALLGFLAMLVY